MATTVTELVSGADDNFTLTFEGRTTNILHPTISADELLGELNHLSTDIMSVTQYTNIETNSFNVTFIDAGNRDAISHTLVGDRNSGISLSERLNMRINVAEVSM
jgi:hypothetical protein